MFRTSYLRHCQQNTPAQAAANSVQSAADRRGPGVQLITVYLAILVFSALPLTGCGDADRATSATVPRPSAHLTDDSVGPDFDAMMLDEFP